MNDLNDIFLNTKANFNNIIQYGFKKYNDSYKFSCPIMDNQFTLNVSIDNDGKVKTKTIDNQTKEEYILHLLPDTQGGFVLKVKREVEEILTDIKEKCFEKFIFKNDQTQTIIKYVRDKYNDELEFLWEKFSNNAIWRRKDNRKWYALLLTVAQNKLAGKSSEIVEILDVRANEKDIPNLIDNKSIFPGYHMNKKYWITVLLDGKLKNKTIFDLINKSSELADK